MRVYAIIFEQDRVRTEIVVIEDGAVLTAQVIVLGSQDRPHAGKKMLPQLRQEVLRAAESALSDLVIEYPRYLNRWVTSIVPKESPNVLI